MARHIPLPGMRNGAHLLSLLLFVLPLFSRADTPPPSDLRARLLSVEQAWSLDDPSLKPWHMKVSYDLLNPKGTITEHGTLEQWWASPLQYRWTITSPSYTATEIRSGGKLYRTTGAQTLPSVVYVLHRQLISAIPSNWTMDKSDPTLEQKQFGKAQLDCVMLAPPRKKSDTPPPLFLFPTYCLDPGMTSLRLSAATGGQVIARNRLAHFQGKSVALDLTISEDQAIALKATVDQLTDFTPTDTDFQPTPDQVAISDTPARVGGGVVAGLKISGAEPVYPVEAKLAHISGTVLLYALIGRDGRVYDLMPIRSPDASLTYSAVAAVRRWTYRPYTLNGEPVEIQTNITVNYAIGR